MPVKKSGTVAQLVRAPSLYLGGRWFESIPSHQCEKDTVRAALTARLLRLLRDFLAVAFGFAPAGQSVGHSDDLAPASMPFEPPAGRRIQEVDIFEKLILV